LLLTRQIDVEFSLFRWRWPLYKHIRLAIGFLDTLARYVEIAFVQFYADELATQFDAGNSGCAAAHEGV
jgi:hypothetical protein